jgi:hypothetical protein
MFGMPSFYFTNWFFYYPEYWHHYPYLCNGYVNHYYGPRHVATSNSLVIRGWVSDNGRYLPHDFMSATVPARVETIRQVGQLYLDAGKTKGGKVTPAIRDQYFQQNVTKYPALNPATSPRLQPVTKPQNIQDIREQPAKQPPVHIPPKIEQQSPSRNSPHPVEAPKPAKETRNYNFENIKKAQDFHRNTWEQAQPRQQVQPAPRMQSAPHSKPSPAPIHSPAPQQSSPGRKK